jgi:hypothetical protein
MEGNSNTVFASDKHHSAKSPGDEGLSLILDPPLGCQQTAVSRLETGSGRWGIAAGGVHIELAILADVLEPFQIPCSLFPVIRLPTIVVRVGAGAPPSSL